MQARDSAGDSAGSADNVTESGGDTCRRLGKFDEGVPIELGKGFSNG